VYVLSQVTQKATLQQRSTKAEFLQVRQFFSYFSNKPHIPFRSEIQGDYEKFYEASGSPYGPEYNKIRSMKRMLLVRKYLGETVKREENNGITLSIYSRTWLQCNE